MGKYYNNETPTNSASKNNNVNQSVNTGKVNNTTNKNDNKVNNNANNNANNTVNNTENNKQDNEVNNIVNNNVNNNTNNTTVNNTQNTVVNEEVTVTDEQKAIDLAKKEFGTTEGVYFKKEQTQGNGIYIVSVRDSETTKALEWYTVNVKNGTVQSN